MPVAVLFLLLGTLAAEISLFGIWTATVVGAGLHVCSALSLVLVGLRRRRNRLQAAAAVEVRQATRTPAPRPAVRRPSAA